ETMIDATLNYSRGLSHDPVNNTLYWASGFQADEMMINRMDLETDNVAVILNAEDHGLLSPLGIGLDPQNEHIYWSDSEKNAIERADFTGESITTISEGSLDTPRDIDVFVNEIITSSENISGIPSKIELEQNYPNPFNPSTNISFQLNESELITLSVHDILGRRVKTLINNSRYTSGRHTISFNAGDLSSGVYIYRLEPGTSVHTKKLTLIK
ncbi:MAG: T9SS type A sorting domain-containing protein, partial [Bacteroidota bacterium]